MKTAWGLVAAVHLVYFAIRYECEFENLIVQFSRESLQEGLQRGHARCLRSTD